MERVNLVLMGAEGVIFSFEQVLGSSQELMDWRMHALLWLQRGCSNPHSYVAVFNLDLNCAVLLFFLKMPDLESYCENLQDLSETLKSCLFLIPSFLPFNICFILLYCVLFCFVFV